MCFIPEAADYRALLPRLMLMLLRLMQGCAYPIQAIIQDFVAPQYLIDQELQAAARAAGLWSGCDGLARGKGHLHSGLLLRLCVKTVETA